MDPNATGWMDGRWGLSYLGRSGKYHEQSNILSLIFDLIELPFGNLNGSCLAGFIGRDVLDICI